MICPRCKAEMDEVARIAPLPRASGLVAYQCSSCRYTTSEILPATALPLKMRPAGLGHGVYKDVPDYNVFCGDWCIGRIYETRTGPADLRWFWALHAPAHQIRSRRWKLPRRTLGRSGKECPSENTRGLRGA
jgi:hypothetical protein